MKFDYLREFIIAAQSDELGHAAQKLGISMSVLSKHMKAIELEIGEPLFVRARKTILSQYGRILLPYAQELVALESEYRQDFAKSVKSDGELTVGLSSFQYKGQAGKSLENFILANTSLKINTVEAGNSELCELVKNGTCDVAFVRSQPSIVRDPELVYFPYSVDKMAAFLTADHPLARRDSISLSDLRDEKILLRSENSAIYRVVLAECSRLGFDPDIAFEGLFTIHERIRNGEGVTLYLSAPIISDHGSPFVTVPIKPDIVSFLDIVYRRDSYSKPIELFLQRATMMKQN